MDEMTRFEQCAASYGQNRSRWPSADQPLYDRFARTDWGQVVLAEAEAVDHFLDRYTVDEPGADWLAGLAAVAAPPPPLFNRRGVVYLGAAFASIALLGFAQGGFNEWRNGTPADEQVLLGSLLVATSGAS